MNHDLIEELLAAQALGGLDAAEAEALASARAEHGSACLECARLEQEFAEAAAALALDLEPVPVREGFEDEVVTSALAERPAGTPAEVAPRAWSRPVEVAPSPWARRLGALAAAAALLLGGFALGRITLDETGPTGDLAVLRLQGDAPGAISVAYGPGGGVVVGSGIPDAQGNGVYALWTITGETPTLLGCFAPEAGALTGSFDGAVGGADLMAVTVEASPCPDAPTSDPIFVGEIVAA
jgi:hypothetical protein